MKCDKYSVKEMNAILKKYSEDHGGFEISEEAMEKLPWDSAPDNKENGCSEFVLLFCEKHQFPIYYCHKDRGDERPKGIYTVYPIPTLPDLHMSMEEIRLLKPIIAIKDSNLADLAKELHNLTREEVLKKYGVEPMPDEEE